jgi:hypothetical protein
MSVQAQELADTADQLKELVQRFKLVDQAAPAPADVRKPAARSVVPLRRVA